MGDAGGDGEEEAAYISDSDSEEEDLDALEASEEQLDDDEPEYQEDWSTADEDEGSLSEEHEQQYDTPNSDHDIDDGEDDEEQQRPNPSPQQLMPQQSEGQPSTIQDASREDLACLICFEAVSDEGPHKPACLKCGHVFGLSCINHWLQAGQGVKKCPTCNKKARLHDVIPLFHLPTIINGQPAAGAARDWQAQLTELNRAKELLAQQLKKSEDDRVADVRRHRRELEATKRAAEEKARAQELLLAQATTKAPLAADAEGGLGHVPGCISQGAVSTGAAQGVQPHSSMPMTNGFSRSMPASSMHARPVPACSMPASSSGGTQMGACTPMGGRGIPWQMQPMSMQQQQQLPLCTPQTMMHSQQQQLPLCTPQITMHAQQQQQQRWQQRTLHHGFSDVQGLSPWGQSSASVGAGEHRGVKRGFSDPQGPAGVAAPAAAAAAAAPTAAANTHTPLTQPAAAAVNMPPGGGMLPLGQPAAAAAPTAAANTQTPLAQPAAAAAAATPTQAAHSQAPLPASLLTSPLCQPAAAATAQTPSTQAKPLQAKPQQHSQAPAQRLALTPLSMNTWGHQHAHTPPTPVPFHSSLTQHAVCTPAPQTMHMRTPPTPTPFHSSLTQQTMCMPAPQATHARAMPTPPPFPGNSMQLPHHSCPVAHQVQHSGQNVGFEGLSTQSATQLHPCIPHSQQAGYSQLEGRSGMPLAEPDGWDDPSPSQPVPPQTQSMPVQQQPRLSSILKLPLVQGGCFALHASGGILLACDRSRGSSSACVMHQVSLEFPQAPGRYTLPEAVKGVDDMCLSPDGSTCALATKGAGLVLTSTHTLSMVATYSNVGSLGANACSCAWSRRSGYQIYVGQPNGIVSLVDLHSSGDTAVLETFGGLERPIHTLVSLPSQGIPLGQHTQETGASDEVEVLAATTAGVWGLSPWGATGLGHSGGLAASSGTRAANRPLCNQQAMGRRTCEGVARHEGTGAVAVSWRAPSCPSLNQAHKPVHIIYSPLPPKPSPTHQEGSTLQEASSHFMFRGRPSALAGHASSSCMTRGCFVDAPQSNTGPGMESTTDQGPGTPPGFWAAANGGSPWFWCLRTHTVAGTLDPHPTPITCIEAGTSFGKTIIVAGSKSRLDVYSS